MTDDAEVVFFLQGAHAVTARFAIQHMRERGLKVGMVRSQNDPALSHGSRAGSSQQI